MLKKIKPEQVFKITKIDFDGYLRMNYAPSHAQIVSCVMKFKNNKKIPEFSRVLEEADIILTSDNPDELETFSKDKWIKVELILKDS